MSEIEVGSAAVDPDCPSGSNLSYRSSASKESVRLALSLAWQDHFHTRDQTWQSLKVEAILAAGLVGVEWQLRAAWATVGVGILVMLAAFFGGQISLHHRNKVMVTKFAHITRCQEKLRLLGCDLIDVAPEQKPSEMKFTDVFRILSVNNSSAFILRMHVAIFLFALLFVLARLVA